MGAIFLTMTAHNTKPSDYGLSYTVTYTPPDRTDREIKMACIMARNTRKQWTMMDKQITALAD